MEQQLVEAVDFFKHANAYHPLFILFRKKYESLGRIGGTVKITSFSKKDVAEIGRFFGVPGEQLAKKGTISLVEFEKQLENTRFNAITLKDLLDAYFGEVILSKKEQQQMREASLVDFLNVQKNSFPGLVFWFDFLFEQKNENRWILKLAEHDPVKCTDMFELLHRAWAELPTEPERLPIFAQRITGDPHAFDLQRDLGKMFIHLLSVYEGKIKEEVSIVEVASSTEEINTVLENSLIYRDDLLNFVTCANLIAETKEGIHPVWKAASRERTVQIVPLREIVPCTAVYPSKGQVVWMVENSGVCATLLDYIPDAPLISTNGQFTLATLRLLDLLAENGCTLYYASDFDPEGLGMAERLLIRYPKSVRLWRMDDASYEQSEPTYPLSEDRLEKLSKITEEELVSVAEKMHRIGKAGYQEALVKQMYLDIKEQLE